MATGYKSYNKSYSKSYSKSFSSSSGNTSPSGNGNGYRSPTSNGSPTSSKESPAYIATKYPQLVTVSTKYLMKALEEAGIPADVAISAVKVYSGHGNDKDLSVVNNFVGMDDYSVVNYYDLPNGVLADVALKSKMPDLAFNLLNSLAEKLKPVLERHASISASPKQ